MAEKDKVEKLLEDYPDVFADIINVLIYDGKQIVKPEELRTTNIQSQYKASDDVLHEEERDTLKEWTKGKDYKVFFGIENQTTKDRKMPLRVIAYDGASYRSQMLKKQQKDFCKVITLVLHFGNRRWKGNKELQEIIKKQSGEEDRFLKLDLKRDEKGEITMCTILDAAEQRGYSRGEKNGINKGINKGKKIGQDEILELVKILIARNRLKDIDRIYEDEAYREQLIKVYSIVTKS